MQSRTKSLRKRELGQFLTPAPIADFMASFFSTPREEWRILDAGAGAGALSLALVSRICKSPHRPISVEVTAYELDGKLLPQLTQAYEQARRQCQGRGIRFTANIRHEDFIEAATAMISDPLFEQDSERFNAAILNPPYRKVNSESPERLSLRAAGIETSNLYAGFLALATQLMSDGGEIVAITPRSFCNGPYFRPFRKLFLSAMSLRQFHVFDSRSTAFGQDGVLQENVIVHAVKSRHRAGRVLISSSSGEPGAPIKMQERDYSDFVSPDDSDSVIHLVTEDAHDHARQRMSLLFASLSDLGLTVSTGRVVDFRAQKFLRTERAASDVPLIRPCHFREGVISWPSMKQRKPCAIAHVDETDGLLVPAGIYVLVKRFSAKEEKRRVVAAVFDPRIVSARKVGFENHLNYFHVEGRGFNNRLARGLSAFLNSTTVDSYFRHFSGHTQVNAADLRRLKYPTRVRLESLGEKVEECGSDQKAIDELVNQEAF